VKRSFTDNLYFSETSKLDGLGYTPYRYHVSGFPKGYPFP
jgi:hypothetical protein